jgi:hypothetical protein
VSRRSRLTTKAKEKRFAGDKSDAACPRFPYQDRFRACLPDLTGLEISFDWLSHLSLLRAMK